jgi:hypothetical protein
MRTNHIVSIGMTSLALLAGCLHAAATIYYVDSATGGDGRSGTSPDQAWKTLDRVHRETFRPGDVLLFKAGTRYTGPFRPSGSGGVVEGVLRPIRVGSYGEGPRPRIDGQGKVLDTVLLKNMEYWELNDLEITNQGEERAPWRTGVRLVSDGAGTLRHLVLSNLFVHDVNGDLRKTHEGCGIYFESRGGRGSRFDGLRIENCHLARTDRNGICQRTHNGTRSTGVVIRGNRLEDIGGDGIKVWGSNGALIEHNVLLGGRMRCQDYAAGIWPFDSDDTLIQFNEVSGMKGTKDGQGFDSDYRCRRSVFQYNYSHDNEGGFMLICSPGHSYNEDTVIRYNISQNDGVRSARVFHFGGGARNVHVYNNTIFVGPDQDLPLLLFTEWDRGNADGVFFHNNLFFVEGVVRYEMGKSRNMEFDQNVFWGNHNNPPAGVAMATNRPALQNPGTGGSGRDSLRGYIPEPNQPFPRGRIIQANGGRDFFGTPVAAEARPCVGAAEGGR